MRWRSPNKPKPSAASCERARTSLASQAQRGARPGGEPCPPVDRRAGGHSGATASRPGSVARGGPPRRRDHRATLELAPSGERGKPETKKN